MAVTIKGDGTVSTGLNADSVDGNEGTILDGVTSNIQTQLDDVGRTPEFQSSSYTTVVGGGTTTIPDGLWYISAYAGESAIILQVRVAGTWMEVSTLEAGSASYDEARMVFSDGVNVRVSNTAGTLTGFYLTQVYL